MRRPLVAGLIVRKRGISGGIGRESDSQHRRLTPQPREFIPQFQHRLVLFGDMPFEVGDLLFESSNVFVQDLGRCLVRQLFRKQYL